MLEIIVFVSGALVMILELAGSRIVSPYLGESIIVWTGLIGIILGSLSFGYWVGGKLADKKPTYKTLGIIFFLSSFYVWIISSFYESILGFFQDRFLDLRTQSVLSIFVLFSPPNLLLGVVTPYAVRLKLKNLKEAGRISGNFYALSTIGSIIGTFTAGFFLIQILGSNNVLLLVSSMLIICSFMVFAKQYSLIKSLPLLALLLVFLFINGEVINDSEIILDKDTLYNRVILDTVVVDGGEGKMIRMFTGRNFQAAMFLDDDLELVLATTRVYRLIEHFLPDVESVLMIGGGGYSFPKYFLERFPEAEIDVVEIDAGVTEIARKYFRLKDDKRLNIYHTDGRVFLNKVDTKYDAIIVDAFIGDFNLPFQLATLEAVTEIYNSVKQEGLVMVNIIDGGELKLLIAELATYSHLFPQVRILAVRSPDDINRLQNFILVARKRFGELSFTGDDEIIKEYADHVLNNEVLSSGIILTDDYAPIEQYLVKFSNRPFKR